jgi:hypothetical protein
VPRRRFPRHLRFPDPNLANEDGLVVWSKNSCGITRVVFQQPPEPFATPNRAGVLCVVVDGRKEQHIALALMVPLVMKMLDILRQCMAERRFSTQDEPRQTLLFDRSHPALRVGVQIRRPRRSNGTRVTPAASMIC